MIRRFLIIRLLYVSIFTSTFCFRFCFSANLVSNLSRDREPETKEKGLTRVVVGGGGADIGGLLAVAIWGGF